MTSPPDPTDPSVVPASIVKRCAATRSTSTGPLRCRLVDGHVGPHRAGDAEWRTAVTEAPEAASGVPPSECVILPPGKTEPNTIYRSRPSWPETWMAIAHAISQRSYDPRLKVGAIIVSADNTQMLSGGYNGNYSGGPHEHESSEPGQSGFIHAEVNALVKHDFNFPKEKHMYVTHSPCRMCAKLIINAGIKRVVYDVAYRDPAGLNLLNEAGVTVRSIREEMGFP